MPFWSFIQNFFGRRSANTPTPSYTQRTVNIPTPKTNLISLGNYQRASTATQPVPSDQLIDRAPAPATVFNSPYVIERTMQQYPDTSYLSRYNGASDVTALPSQVVSAYRKNVINETKISPELQSILKLPSGLDSTRPQSFTLSKWLRL